MTRRHLAYFSALKFHFAALIYHSGLAPREAYAKAKNIAAVYAFRATTDHLNFITL